MPPTSRDPASRLAAVTLLWLAAAGSGCVATTAQLFYMVKGEKIEARYDGLPAHRVAVVCVANSSAYAPGSAAASLAGLVSQDLIRNIKKIDIVPPEDIEDWLDNNSVNRLDYYRKVGTGVDADLVVAVDLDSFSLYEGQTLFKGRAEFSVTVYDMTQGGKVAYSDGPHDFAFPEHGAMHATEMNEANFQRLFLRALSEHIAHQFYDYDLKTEFGKEAAAMP